MEETDDRFLDDGQDGQQHEEGERLILARRVAAPAFALVLMRLATLPEASAASIHR